MKRLLLFVSLFSLNASAMESVKVKDVEGVEFTLTQDQRYVLKQCKIFKPLLQTSKNSLNLEADETIDFTDFNRPFITKKNIELLATFIANEQIKPITDEKKAVELFQLADYLMASKSIIKPLAQETRKDISVRVVTIKERIKSSLPITQEDKKIVSLDAVAKQYCMSLGDLLEKHFISELGNKNILRNSGVLGYNRTPGSSYEICILQIPASLKLSEKIVTTDCANLKHYSWAKEVVELELPNQIIEHFSIKSLKSVFPKLRKINLKNNRISNNVEQMIDDTIEEIDLDDNPITSFNVERMPSVNQSYAASTNNTWTTINLNSLKSLPQCNLSLRQKWNIYKNAFNQKMEYGVVSATAGVVTGTLASICLFAGVDNLKTFAKLTSGTMLAISGILYYAMYGEEQEGRGYTSSPAVTINLKSKDTLDKFYLKRPLNFGLWGNNWIKHVERYYPPHPSEQ